MSWKKSNVFIGDSSSITLENWIAGDNEIVELKDTIPPLDITNLIMTDLGQNYVSLQWTESASNDAKNYQIYNGTTLLTTVPATTVKLNPIATTVSGFIMATNYTLTIKTVDTSDNISNGVNISFMTFGNNAVSLDGINNNHVTMNDLALVYDRFDIDVEVDSSQPQTLSDIFRGNNTVGSAYIRDLSDTDKKVHYTHTYTSPISGSIDFFGASNGYHQTKGKIYRIVFYLNGVVVKNYDFSIKSTDDAQIFGTWITW